MAKKKKAKRSTAKRTTKKRTTKKKAARKNAAKKPVMRKLAKSTGWMPATAVKIVKGKGGTKVLVKRAARKSR